MTPFPLAARSEEVISYKLHTRSNKDFVGNGF